MADELAVAALRAGGGEWNKFAQWFAKESPDRPFDFTDADLEGVVFSGVEFGRRAQFDGSRFKDAKFDDTRFDQGASFVASTFQGTTKIRTRRVSADLSFDQATFQGPLVIEEIQNCRIVRFVTTRFLEGLSAGGNNESQRIVLSPLSFQQAIAHGPLAFNYCTFQMADFSASRLALPLQGMNENVCYASFRNCIFLAQSDFTGAEFAHGANFENAKFQGSSSFRRTVFNKAPNFHDATLHQGTQFSSKDDFPSLFRDISSPGAAEAYRTLKLAMNKQHALNEELGFFLLEMRATARRLSWWRQVPYRLYDWMSMYGQSVLRPLWLYLAIHVVFGIIYSLLSGQRWEAIDARLTSLTLYGAVPFAAALRWPEVSSVSASAVFPPSNLLLVQLAIVFQSILSAVFLFLIGLGLRNMFKVR